MVKNHYQGYRTWWDKGGLEYTGPSWAHKGACWKAQQDNTYQSELSVSSPRTIPSQCHLGLVPK